MKSLRTAWIDERAQLQAETDRIFDAANARSGSDSPGLTADERSRLDAIEARQTEIAADLEREERRRERERQAVGPIADDSYRLGYAVQAQRAHDWSAGRDLAADRPWGVSTFGATLTEFLLAHPAPFTPPDSPAHPRRIYQNAAFGEFLQAVHSARSGRPADPRLLYEAAAQGAGESIAADGGYLVPKQMSDDIRLRLFGGEILSRVRSNTLTAASLELNVVNETSRATGSRHGAVQGYWVDEGTAPTATRPKFAQVTFKPRKVAALGYATDELLADVNLIGALMFDAFSDELKFLTEDSIINGTGAGQPLGILNAACLVSITKETNQVATTLVYENLLKAWARLYAPSRSRSVWLINQDVETQLGAMTLSVGTGGVPVYMPASGISGSPYSTLFGRPVIPVEYAATLGTVGDVILADLSEYWLFDKGAPQQASSMHVAFTTDEQAFRVTYRVDGQPYWRSALTPYKGTGNTQSPFVVIATRA